MSQFKRIFIVGHPGAGKALLAKTLAEKLGWQFIDADLGLEFRIGRHLNDILGSQDKTAFLDCQSSILAYQLKQENIVVATDASIIFNDKNWELLAAELVVYLKVSTQVQLTRTARSPKPLLPLSELKEFLDLLHLQRDDLYDQIASMVINSDDSALKEHVANVAKLVTENVSYNNNRILLDKNDLNIFHKSLHIPIQLTNQQAKCLKLLAQGQSSKEIARELDISYRTVEGCIAKLMQLLGCNSSKELVALYHDQP